MTDPKTLRVLAEAIPPKGASYIAAANPQTITTLCDLLTEALTALESVANWAECRADSNLWPDVLEQSRAVLDKAAAMGVRG